MRSTRRPRVSPASANGCLTPWQKDPATYGRAVLSRRYRDCEDEVVAQLRDLLAQRLDYEARDGRELPRCDAEGGGGARLIRSAEQYYLHHVLRRRRKLEPAATATLFETLEQLLQARGPDAKAVVWAA